ncbi:50S ribosomal protein L11 methyltransferase [Crenothrix sp.]|uniref:50S ribosomal protein L11 methyltransferase n=1 Tax=Crenothrix sp. TaxID=3100433 RepID=UPI00374CF1A9
MAWHQLSVISDEHTAPLIADFFSDLGAVSVTYMDAEDEPVYEPAIGETKIWSNTQVIALYELDADPDAIKAQVIEHFQSQALLNWQYDEIGDQAWERAWMEFYKPMKFADKLWVCPTDQQQHEPKTVCLILDPGLAFGTGTHPTTALCLEWLASHDLTGKTVIDYGCGSGILAVAAVLLGAKIAHAVDIDPQAITATESNALKNNVQDKIHCYLPNDFPVLQADIVLANILAKPLIDMSEMIASLLVPNGTLILSGILHEQADAVITAYQSHIALQPLVQQEDWIRLSGAKH